MHECPRCETDLDDGWLYNRFADFDYSNPFEIVCPHCRAVVEVEAKSVPEFTVGKFLREATEDDE